MLDNNHFAFKVEKDIVNVDEIVDFINSIPVDKLSADEKAQIFKVLQERFLGFKMPGHVHQSLSLGGVQIVGGHINLNVLDAKSTLESVEKLIEKNPEFIIKIAEVIAKKV